MTTGKPVLSHIEISSTDMDSYKAVVNNKTWEVTETYGAAIKVKTATIYLARSASGALTMDETLNGSLVTIQRGISSATEKYVFRGHVVNVRLVGHYYVVKAADKLALTAKRKVTTSFDVNIDSEAGKFSEIFKTLINDYTSLTADATSVQDSGTTRTISKFICRGASVLERCSTLMETIGWQAYYDPDTDKVYAEPPGYTTQATSIEEGVNILEVPKWDLDASELYNKVEVRGAVQEVETTESGQIGVTSGYTTDDVQLTKEPISVKVFCDSSNPPTTLRTGGVESSTATYDYIVDTANKKIEWSDTYTPGGSDYVEVQYSYFEPAPVVLDDQPSIKAYSEDPDNPEAKEIVLHKNDIKKVTDAENYGAQYLEDHKDPIQKTKIKVTDISDLSTGQRVYIDDTTNSKSGYFYIEELKMKSPYTHDEIKVASNIIDEDNYEWEISQRVKRLEEQNEGEDGILLHVKDFTKTIKFARHSFETTRYKICDSFIVGHRINSLVGMGTELEGFETGAAANWSSSGVTDADESGTYLVGSGSLSVARATGSGTGYIQSTQSWGDLSAYTGAASGNPTQGTIGIWLYTTAPTVITALNIRIGSGSSAYRSIDATAYASVDGYHNWDDKTYELQSGWNYLLFHLTDGSNTGTPNWTAVDYCRLTFTFTANTTLYIDYLTISKSDYIGLNGVGVRRMEIS